MVLAPRSGSTRRWRKLRAFVLRRDGGKLSTVRRRRREARVSSRHSAHGGRSGCSFQLPNALFDLSRYPSRATLGSVRGVDPPDDHFGVLGRRYNFAIEL